jgi:hypothetical protein
MFTLALTMFVLAMLQFNHLEMICKFAYTKHVHAHVLTPAHSKGMYWIVMNALLR